MGPGELCGRVWGSAGTCEPVHVALSPPGLPGAGEVAVLSGCSVWVRHSRAQGARRAGEDPGAADTRVPSTDCVWGREGCALNLSASEGKLLGPKLS